MSETRDISSYPVDAWVPPALELHLVSEPTPVEEETVELVTDERMIRRKAIARIEQGPFNAARSGDIDREIDLLNQALATQLVSVSRHRRHLATAEGLNALSVASAFLDHAEEKTKHVTLIATRVRQLGGMPNFRVTDTTRNLSTKIPFEQLEEMVCENLFAEHVTIDICNEIIAWLGDGDPFTRSLLKRVVVSEQRHADTMRNLLIEVNL